MRILKFKGKSEEIILKQIEKEYGKNAMIIHTQKEESTGHFKWFKSPRIVVTVAIKEESDLEMSHSFQTTYKEVAETQSAPQQDNFNETSEASYELLKELQAQLGVLHQEIGDLKKVPKSTPVQVVNSDGTLQVNRLATCMEEKLMNLGLKKEVCQQLLARIDSEESEVFITELYSTLEEKLIEKDTIDLPQIIFFIGSTGVGKTTTLAKLTAQYVLEQQKKVVLFTSDTYRIAAVEQLKTYADILGVEIEIIYDENELPQYIEKWRHVDHILIDTAGRSHKNEEQVTELKALMDNIKEKQVYLVLNANTTARDIKKIMETYEKITSNFDLIITKLDETDEIGNIINISYYTNKAIHYLTIGQNVPSDIEVFNKQNFITELLGRLNDE
ncbi:MAG: flagellar biosynthesis protein FlhF [Cellulosilyticum sp.]|nr:flagellar biosynthesis protein FlhF [Cellulosilyticum sp.]